MNKTTVNRNFCLPCDVGSGKQSIRMGLDFEFILGNITQVPENYSTGWRTMPFHMCACGLDIPDHVGSVVHIEGSDPVTIEGNSLIFMPADTPHRIDDYGTPHTSLWIHFRTIMLGELDLFSLFKMPPLVRQYPSGPVVELMKKIVHQPAVLNTTESVWMKMYGLSLSLELLQLAASVAPLHAGELSPGMQRLFPALSLLNNAQRKPEVHELAELLHLSPSRFLALFHAELGISPGKYFKQVLFGRACKLLGDPRTLIGECADQLGFCDQYHFCREFHKIAGMSPSQYRKTIIQRS